MKQAFTNAARNLKNAVTARIPFTQAWKERKRFKKEGEQLQPWLTIPKQHLIDNSVFTAEEIAQGDMWKIDTVSHETLDRESPPVRYSEKTYNGYYCHNHEENSRVVIFSRNKPMIYSYGLNIHSLPYNVVITPGEPFYTNSLEQVLDRNISPDGQTYSIICYDKKSDAPGAPKEWSTSIEINAVQNPENPEDLIVRHVIYTTPEQRDVLTPTENPQENHKIKELTQAVMENAGYIKELGQQVSENPNRRLKKFIGAGKDITLVYNSEEQPTSPAP